MRLACHLTLLRPKHPQTCRHPKTERSRSGFVCCPQYARRWRLSQEPTSSAAPLRQSNAIRCPITGQSPAHSERRGTGHRPARPSAAKTAEGSSTAGDVGRRDGARRRPGQAPVLSRACANEPPLSVSFTLRPVTCDRANQELLIHVLRSPSRLLTSHARMVRTCGWGYASADFCKTLANVLAGGMVGRLSSRPKSHSRRCARRPRVLGAPKAAMRAPRLHCRTPGATPTPPHALRCRRYLALTRTVAAPYRFHYIAPSLTPPDAGRSSMSAVAVPRATCFLSACWLAVGFHAGPAAARQSH